MIKILFVCHGNICRSPMAEFVMKDLVKKKGIEEQFYIASAATSTEEIGNPIYPPARRKLAQVGIRTDGKTARQMTRQDYDKFDYLIGMEDVNVRNMLRITGGDPDGKISRLLDYTGRPGNIADPWYTGNFDDTYDDVLKGCESLIEYLKKEGKII
ncbi:MAG: low molecular weight phosphotyrosine protein phosphatase [Lachnospira sp.]|nr:low molecular weight phosphotyrosine protein phosphatase [Lachnospira sp.]